MARVKNEKIKKENEVAVDTNNVETKAENSTDINYQEYFTKMINDLTKEINELKAERDMFKKSAEATEQVVSAPVSNDNGTEKALVGILQTMAENKSNKEVTIVHGQEMAQGLSTTIVLSNLTIAFRHLGEQRVLTWQQFEELVSKYPNFIKRGIILLDEAHSDLCEKYQMKCYLPKDKATLTPEKLRTLGDLSMSDLEKLFNGLSSENQRVLMSYWLGKCYEQDKDPKFYDRYKIELLNRLSNSYAFGNVLADMNMEDVKKRREN